MLKQMDGIREGRCMDADSLDKQPGGQVHVFPCDNKWSQLFSFGNGKEAPCGSLVTSVPLHTINRIAETGRTQEKYMCLGVAGRGDKDEEDWLGIRDEESNDEDGYDEDEDYAEGDEEPGDPLETIDKDSYSVEDKDGLPEDTTVADGELLPLDEWVTEQLISTRCSNSAAVVEFVLVPFIIEDGENPATADNDTEAEEL